MERYLKSFLSYNNDKSGPHLWTSLRLSKDVTNRLLDQKTVGFVTVRFNLATKQLLLQPSAQGMLAFKVKVANKGASTLTLKKAPIAVLYQLGMTNGKGVPLVPTQNDQRKWLGQLARIKPIGNQSAEPIKRYAAYKEQRQLPLEALLNQATRDLLKQKPDRWLYLTADGLVDRGLDNALSIIKAQKVPQAVFYQVEKTNTLMVNKAAYQHLTKHGRIRSFEFATTLDGDRLVLLPVVAGPIQMRSVANGLYVLAGSTKAIQKLQHVPVNLPLPVKALEPYAFQIELNG